MSIQEILEAHDEAYWDQQGHKVCACGHEYTDGYGSGFMLDHVAQVIEQHMQEQYAVKLERLAENVLKMGGPVGPQQTSEWLASRARIERVMHMLVPPAGSFIGSILEVALNVPGSRVLVVTPSQAAVAQEIHEELKVAAQTARYGSIYSGWKLNNGSEIHLGWINGSEDTSRYRGNEFQLIAFDDMDRYDPLDVAYMGSRLRAEGVLREQMDAHGLQLRCIFRDANGVMA